MKIPPEATPTDATMSMVVCTVMPVALPAVAAPMVRPVSVIVTAVLAAIVGELLPAIVMTMKVSPGGLMGVKLALLTDTVPEGVGLVAKNPDGYVSVMISSGLSAPFAEVVNENVAAAPVLPATRSPAAMVNVTAVV